MSPKSPENTKRINVFFSTEVLEKIKVKAHESGASVSGFVRSIVMSELGKKTLKPVLTDAEKSIAQGLCPVCRKPVESARNFKCCGRCGTELDWIAVYKEVNELGKQ